MTDNKGNRSFEDIERAMDAADAASGADRSAITQAAQLDAAEAVAMAGLAMEADAELAEASRITIMASRAGDKEQARLAHRREREAYREAKANHKAATRSAKRAYDAIRFSDPNSLGFLRVLQAFLLLNIIFTSMMLTTFIKGSYTIDFNETLNLVNVLFDGVIFWLIWKRKKITRTCVIAIATFNIVVGTIFNIATGVFDPLAQFALSMFDVFLLVYFIFSKRVKSTLVEPFNMRKLNEDLDEDESFFRPTTWEFWRNLIIYFVIFSIVGHWMEAGVCLLIKYGLVPGTYDATSQIWSDWLYPFPVYGIGFCACAVLLYPLKNLLERKTGKLGIALVLSFLANALVCTIIEFTMGMFVNADLQLWDYSNMFGNFMGQVCLQNALFFGFVATIMTWLVYPALEQLFRRVPNESMTVVFVVVLVGFVVLMALYYINVPINDVEAALESIEETEQVAESASSAVSASSGSAA